MNTKPFHITRKQDRRTYRLPVLLSAREQQIVFDLYDSNRGKYSSISDMIRQLIAAGIEATTDTNTPTSQND